MTRDPITSAVATSTRRALRCLLGFFLVVARISAATFGAATDFTPATQAEFAPYYRETGSPTASEHGVAIDTVKHHARPAAAELVFNGTTGTYDVTLLAVAEEDGESIYRLVINGRDQGLRQNPAQSAKRVAVLHRWTGVSVAAGARVQLVFTGHTNGKIPEGSGTAWSRGRWRTLTLTAAPPPTPRIPQKPSPPHENSL